METPAQQCSRLLFALEELVMQEALLISAAEYDEVTRVQERAAPLIDRLAELAPTADVSSRRRALSLIAQRNQNQERIARDLLRVEDELRESRDARSRLTQLAPAYRMTSFSGARRLLAHG